MESTEPPAPPQQPELLCSVCMPVSDSPASSNNLPDALYRYYSRRLLGITNDPMAIIPLSNPQDCECGNLLHTNKQKSPPKRKPNRAFMYLRNRAFVGRNRWVALAMAALLVFLTIHRCSSLYMQHRRWVNAPITYLPRTCPPPEYTPIKRDAGSICIVTLTDQSNPSRLQRLLRWRNYDGILDMTWNNKLDYANKHGYRLFDGSPWMDKSRPPAWSKIKSVQRLLHEEKCDWVMWTDADTVIMNSDITVQSFLTEKDFIVASDNTYGFNSGVFVVQNTQWGKQFLQGWWDMKSFVRPPGMSLSGDNAALKAMLTNLPDKEFAEHVAVPPRCTINSFAKFLTVGESDKVMATLEDQEWYMDERYYHKGDFLAHTPGYDNKNECIRALLEEAR